MAAVCADAQGRFAEMHRQLMTTTEWLSDTNWIQQARVAGVRSTDEFQACLQSEAARERLRVQRALADAIGVDGTPYFVNGRATLLRRLPRETRRRESRVRSIVPIRYRRRL